MCSDGAGFTLEVGVYILPSRERERRIRLAAIIVLSSSMVDLFGGAIVASIPSTWRDVSQVRQVPGKY